MDKDAAGDRERVYCIVVSGFSAEFRRHQQGSMVMPGDMKFVHQLVEGTERSIDEVLRIARFRAQVLPLLVQDILLVSLFRRLFVMRWLLLVFIVTMFITRCSIHLQNNGEVNSSSQIWNPWMNFGLLYSKGSRLALRPG